MVKKELQININWILYYTINNNKNVNQIHYKYVSSCDNIIDKIIF